MLISRICSSSVIDGTPAKAPAEATDLMSLPTNASDAPPPPPVKKSMKSDISFMTVNDFKTEINKALGQHNKTVTVMLDDLSFSGAHHEVIQKLREIQRKFDIEMALLCNRCYEHFIIETCDQVLAPYRYEQYDKTPEEKEEMLSRSNLNSTPTKGVDCTAGQCTTS